ncbi:thiamine pyrophosphate-binding protein [Treponema pedis]|uniref:thiamine pyrophosphate-binding protein n=1 Tax=Treponema pedis TaxID=409322 RepID=UPI003D241537
METYYTSEKNIQILIALLKAHGVKKIIVSPGTTNLTFVASVQQDPFFEIYSSVDERSAAYIACGLAAETNEAVALSCTGATASRNYMPGLTEAYYRKLPILAITSTQHTGRIAHHIAQVIDRTVLPNDITKLSIELPSVYTDEDIWACETKVNKALLALSHKGGGPVHINLVTTYSKDFSIKNLPSVQMITRVRSTDIQPSIPKGKTVVFVGAHRRWTSELTSKLDIFCAKYDAAVFCDHTSNYRGKYQVIASLITNQSSYHSPCKDIDTLIHIGEVSGAYLSLQPKQVWRVNPDGEVRDTFAKLRYIFEMEEDEFFTKYACDQADEYEEKDSFLVECKNEYERLFSKIPELPFSNAWIAYKTAHLLPENSVLHLGILNTLRCWNFFEIPKTVLGYSNTGGFGIDGDMSSLLGASFADNTRLYIGIFGDLAFFYDMNVLGNRHVGSNIRIMLINNGCGTEFKNYHHPAARFKSDADFFMAAAGHYGNKSIKLVKHYAQDLGFEYLSASTKEAYLENIQRFLSPDILDKPLLFEVFTNAADESDALQMLYNLEVSVSGFAKNIIKKVLSENDIQKLKKVIKR